MNINVADYLCWFKCVGPSRSNKFECKLSVKIVKPFRIYCEGGNTYGSSEEAIIHREVEIPSLPNK
ncbi:CLUMA_CG021648, isoform A [Clunio marinus]|uniref:CLUMA_CG021648, isoform A n=1 Tax=Clunio marinus TaxID=568069 RepID=A0A1J1J7Z8_9DIPT|nr:CLUMA_CG021648, isoform A [Clunio marinus]